MAEHDQQFDFFQQWVNKASSWLTRRGPNVRAVCFDTSGTLCANSTDFMAARDAKRFPVRWVWPDQVAARLPALENAITTLINVALPENWFDEDDLEHGDAWLEAARLVKITLPESA